MGGQCRNILPAAFSELTDQRKVNAEKTKGNIFLHWPTNSVDKSFLALLTNPNEFVEKINPTQQNSLADLHVNSLPLCWSMEIKFYLWWVIKLKYSIEIDVYSSQTTVNKILNELFIHFELSKTKANNTDFRTVKPVNTAPDWTGHMTSSASHCTRIPVRNPYCL